MRSRKLLVPGVSLALMLLALGCRGAASVLLDMPPEDPDPPGQTPTASVTPSATGGTIVFAQDTTHRPIEFVSNPDSVLAMLPRDRAGSVDWVAALREGIINPRRYIPGRERLPSRFDYDFLLKGEMAAFDAFFPHSAHVEQLDCSSCHPGIYPYRNEPITMAQVNAGESCGQCHGAVSFPASACERCHTQMGPREGRLTAELRGDIRFARATDSTGAPVMGAFPPARFRHWSHRIRFRCSACHTDVFQLRRSTDTLSMAAMRRGAGCGACHDGGTAFATNDVSECGQCHVDAAAGWETER
jgi:c(7)-type cytochrome triheme protein